MNISFGSTYKLTPKQNFDVGFSDKLYELYKDGVEYTEEFTPYEEAIKTGVFSKITLVAPDKFDEKVESILCAFGINFHKTTKEENEIKAYGNLSIFSLMIIMYSKPMADNFKNIRKFYFIKC